MLFKMLGIERTRRKLDGPKVRQVFVTQSRVLADRVEEYFNNLIQSCAVESQTVEELEWRASKRKEIEKNLMELDEEDDSSSNLPSRFSQLEDKHFPLFLTFDKVQTLWSCDRPTHSRHDSFVNFWKLILPLLWVVAITTRGILWRANDFVSQTLPTSTSHWKIPHYQGGNPVDSRPGIKRYYTRTSVQNIGHIFLNPAPRV
jgi:hypothetical protein